MLFIFVLKKYRPLIVDWEFYFYISYKDLITGNIAQNLYLLHFKCCATCDEQIRNKHLMSDRDGP